MWAGLEVPRPAGHLYNSVFLAQPAARVRLTDLPRWEPPFAGTGAEGLLQPYPFVKGRASSVLAAEVRVDHHHPLLTFGDILAGERWRLPPRRSLREPRHSEADRCLRGPGQLLARRRFTVPWRS